MITKRLIILNLLMLYIASIVSAKFVIPAKAGIQYLSGFRVKPGMTKVIPLIKEFISKATQVVIPACRVGATLSAVGATLRVDPLRDSH